MGYRSKKYRNMLMACYAAVQGFNNRETGELLGISGERVRQYFARIDRSMKHPSSIKAGNNTRIKCAEALQTFK